MKGVASTVLRLLWVSRLQRWFLAVGLALSLCGMGAQAGLWPTGAPLLYIFAAIIGLMACAFMPCVVDPLLFRSLSAPRSIQLIPHGRLQLVLGAFCSQLLIAVLVGAAIGTGSGNGALNSHGIFHALSSSASTAGAQLGTACVLSFGAVSLYFLIFSWSMQYRLGVLMLLPLLAVPRLIAPIFPHLKPGAALTSPLGVGGVLSVTLLAWLVFSIAYVTQRQISVGGWNTVGLGYQKHTRSADAAGPGEPPRYSRPDSIRILMTGLVNVRRTMLWTGVVFGAVSVGFTILTLREARSAEHPGAWPMLLCLYAGMVPGVLAGVMARRAKFLWLTASMGRAEMFIAIERQCWRMTFVAVGVAMLFAVPLLVFGLHARPDPAQLLEYLAAPLAAGATLLYVGLLYVRGNRLTDLMIVAGNTILLAAAFFSTMSEWRGLSVLVSIQIILVPLLREVGRRRWTHVDWLRLRPPLAAARWA